MKTNSPKGKTDVIEKAIDNKFVSLMLEIEKRYINESSLQKFEKIRIE